MAAETKQHSHSDIDVVFFDLDGTLTDPKVGITESIRYALKQLGEPAPNADDLDWCIGPPLLASFETLLKDKQLATQAIALYRQRFAAHGLFENQIYDGIRESLAYLSSTGLQLYVATSKPRVFAEKIISHFDLGNYFQRIFGSELDGRLGDKTELLNYALAETDVAADRTMMVGDRSYDMIGARQNGIYATGVLYGYGSKTELKSAGAQSLVSTPGALSQLHR